jgi:hypothetical protein
MSKRYRREFRRAVCERPVAGERFSADVASLSLILPTVAAATAIFGGQLSDFVD